MNEEKQHDFDRSLSEVYGSINPLKNKKGIRRLFAFMGPAYLVSVGYMDPGNWATDIAGGSKFGYALIWVLLLSNLMALVLQSLCARMGIVTKMDLAQASRVSYSKTANYFLWILAELAIAATDLAEVLGVAIGLELLFGIPMIWGVTITVFDTLLLLYLHRLGIRKMEAFVISMISVIGVSFLIEMFFAQPDFKGIALGMIPSLPSDEALYIAIGIIGATVMPHNLYLHSSLVQTRLIPDGLKSKKKAIRFNILDTTIALNLAFFVNAAILILAAAVFHRSGYYDIADITDAHKLLEPLLGEKLAPILFAVALIAAGQSSTLTGTLSGQIVMEGYLKWRITPWLRRLITRIVAIIPAYIVILMYGEGKTGALLIFSQVFLSLQLGFAVIPLIHFVSNKTIMGSFAIGPLTKTVSWLIAILIVGLNVKLVYNEIHKWIAAAGDQVYLVYLIVLPVAVGAVGLLLYVTIKPLFYPEMRLEKADIHPKTHPVPSIPERLSYSHIAITLDYSASDTKAIQHAISMAGPESRLYLIHITESAIGTVFPVRGENRETNEDKHKMKTYLSEMRQHGFNVEGIVESGRPKTKIPKIVHQISADILVMGSHGHRGMKDLIFGETINVVRHRVDVPVFVI